MKTKRILEWLTDKKNQLVMAKLINKGMDAEKERKRKISKSFEYKLVALHLRRPRKEKKGDWVKTSDILVILQKREDNKVLKISVIRLGKAMQRHRYRSKMISGYRHYLIRKKK